MIQYHLTSQNHCPTPPLVLLIYSQNIFHVKEMIIHATTQKSLKSHTRKAVSYMIPFTWHYGRNKTVAAEIDINCCQGLEVQEEIAEGHEKFLN